MFERKDTKLRESECGRPSVVPTLRDPMDYTVHGILQARILEWAAVPSPGDLPNTGVKLRSLTLQADFYQLSHQGSPAIIMIFKVKNDFHFENRNMASHCRQDCWEKY